MRSTCFGHDQIATVGIDAAHHVGDVAPAIRHDVADLDLVMLSSVAEVVRA